MGSVESNPEIEEPLEYFSLNFLNNTEYSYAENY